MNDLVEWLRAQLDEDERTARAADSSRWLPEDKGITFEYNADDFHEGEAQARLVADTRANQEHIARHDPARVLREVEAKRRRLQRHQPVEDWVGHDHMPAGRRLIGVNCSTCRDGTCGDDYDIYCTPIAWPCPEIRDDLSVYSDRPGYRSEWAS